MPENNKIRKPLDTIPEEARTRPSGVRTLAPKVAGAIPEEIKSLIKRALASDPNKVFVRRIAGNPFMLKSRFHLIPGGNAPVISLSHLAYTDGAVTSSTANRGPLGPKDLMDEDSPIISYAVANTIRGADHIALIKYGTDCGIKNVTTESELVVYARDTDAVDEFIRVSQL